MKKNNSNTLLLVEIHVINNQHECYSVLDNELFKAKNLYNYTLYCIRQHYFSNKTYLSYSQLQKQLQNSNQFDYRKLPSNVSLLVMKLVDQNFRSFFKANKDYQINPSKYKSKPRIPKYLDKVNGRQVLTYTQRVISKKSLDKGILKLTGLNDFQIKTNLKFKDINQVRLVPCLNYIKVEIIYTVLVPEIKEDNLRYASIDLGVNNLMTVTSNVSEPVIFNGKPLKSINHNYNKRKAHLQSKLKPNQYTSKQLRSLESKRYHKIHDYFHKSTKLLMNHLVEKPNQYTYYWLYKRLETRH